MYQMLQSRPVVDPPSPSDSHSVSSLHSLTLSVFLIVLILLITLLITFSIYFLLRRLRRSLLPPHSSSGDCAICLSPFQPEDKLRHLPLCCHAFHADCISVWLVSNQTCPLCRSPLLASDDATTTAESLAADIGHDGSRSWLRDLSRGVSSRALSFRDSGRYFTGSSRRTVVDLEAGEEISEYFRWLSSV
ncbi:unnamed protein product [Thlaspi arvense]|uniref:RING-type E3 ubiquitin transferase n=1 Tax=Thlaspi arvense TaxID=13288 RepID=A0AAU9RB45_THLAR|nr:unnamed protein product [Thlaspi arvense]